MYSSNKEYFSASVACILITGFYGYVLYITGAVPAAGELFGHTLGIIGFVLMLMTEILYSLRKRSRSVRWGKMSDWLQFHIFTGLVGPYMVFLHTSWKFNGLAGVVTLLTFIVVLSGFIGRYIYTRVPRTSDGIEIDTTIGSLQAGTVANARRLLAIWHMVHIPIGMALFVAAFVHIGGALYYSTFLK
ncbi:MAG: hypothetical protein WCP19_10555 [Chloroflexota bacterium]